MDFMRIIFVAFVAGIVAISGAPIYSEVCVQQPRDLFFVVDNSASISRNDFEKVKEFLVDMLSSVDIGKDRTHVGLLVFSNEEKTRKGMIYNLNYDKQVIVNATKNLVYNAGDDTLTHFALKKVEDEVFTKTGGQHKDRKNVPKIIVLATDGKSRDSQKTKQNADSLKDKGVRIITVGVGLENRHELEDIASTKGDIYTVKRFEHLYKIIPKLLAKVCQTVTLPPPTTKRTTQPTTTKRTPPKKTTALPTTKKTTASPTTKKTVPSPTTEKTVPSPTTEKTAPSTQSTRKVVEPTTKIRAPHPGHSQRCLNSAAKDVLFLVDGTAHTQLTARKATRQFNKLKKFVRNVISRIGNDHYRVGVVQYRGKYTTRVDVDILNNAPLTKAAFKVGLMQQMKGNNRRFISSALVAANNEFYKIDSSYEMNRRLNPNLVVLLTRGIPTAQDEKRIMNELQMLEAREIRVIAIATGMFPKRISPFLEKIAAPKDVFVAKYRELKHITEHVLDRICVEVPIEPRGALMPPITQCQRTPHDIFFVVDGSSSIQPHNFEKTKTFLMDLTVLLRPGGSNMNTGLMQYSEIDRLSFIEDLGFHETHKIISDIKNMQYHSGRRTMTGHAIKQVYEQVFNGVGGDRPNIKNILILFTDGTAHDEREAKKQAKLLKQKDVTIITIAASERGQFVKNEVLKEIASKPEYALTVDFGELSLFATKVFPLMCETFGRF